MAVRRTDDSVEAPDTTTPTAAPAWIYYVSTALAAVVLVCTGTLVYLFVAKTGDDSVSDRFSVMFSGQGDASQTAANVDAATIAKEREAVKNVAEQFTLRINTYGPHYLTKQNTMPGYVARVHAISTAKLATSFDQGVTLAEQSVSQQGVARYATIFASAVSSIDADSATAMVAGSLSQSYPDPDHPTDASKRIKYADLPLRWVLQLVKVDDTWKVDDFDAVTGDDGTTDNGQPTQKPTQKPTQAPTGKPTRPRGHSSPGPDTTPTPRPSSSTTKGAGR